MKGSVVRRGKRWYCIVDSYEGTKRKRKWHSGYATKREAIAALTDIVGAINRGEYVPPSKQLLADYLDTWLKGRATQLRPSTLASYRMNVEVHVVPHIGSIRLERLRAADLDGLYAVLQSGHRPENQPQRPLSLRSIRYVHSIIRKGLADAVRKGALSRNVADQADPPGAARTRAQAMKTWTGEELRRFLEASESDRLYPAFLLAAMTGMRRGEVLGLMWRDVNEVKGRIAVRRTLIVVDHKPTLSQPKTDRGYRSVALDQTTLAALKSWHARQSGERLSWGPAYTDHGLVFSREDGSSIHPEHLSKHFAILQAKVGVPRIRLHDLRHSHASHLLTAGVNPKVVSERLGHATVSITLDTYSHAIPALGGRAESRPALGSKGQHAAVRSGRITST